MTIQLCLSYCYPATYAGLEYSDECWCAPYLNANSAKLDDGMCADACAGDAAEICGGALRLSLYRYNGTLAAGGGSGSGSVKMVGAGLRSVVVGLVGLLVVVGGYVL